MRPRAILKWLAITAFVLGVSSSATADSTPPAGTAAADAQFTFTKQQTVSIQEALAQGNVIVVRIDQAAGTVRRQLEGARQARDVVKTLCLNDKLSQIDATGRTARERLSELVSAASQNNTELVNHQYAIMVVLRQRAEQQSAEANQCIGEEVAFVGQTSVETTVNPDLPADTTGYPPPAVIVVIVPPPPATVSPTK